MRAIYVTLAVTSFILLAAGYAHGQVVHGSISGIVKDDQGAIMQRATIEILSLATGRSRSTTTGDHGRFTFQFLPVGEYELRVSRDGYQPTVIKNFRVNLGAQDFIRIELKPVTEFSGEVQVIAAAPLIETTKTTTGNVITNEVIDNLPLFERDFTEILKMQGNVQDARGIAGAGSVVISGGRASDNIFQVDGGDNNSSLSGNRAQYYSLDVIEEVQLSTAGFSSQYGRGAGGVINVVTKSGTNDFSGRISYYLRDDSLDQGSDPGDDWRQQEFSLVFGGPIKRDELFYLVNVARVQRRESFDYLYGFISEEYDQPTLESEDSRNAFFGKINWYPSVKHELTFSLNYEPLTTEAPDFFGLRPLRDGYKIEIGGTAANLRHNWNISNESTLSSTLNVRFLKSNIERNTPSDPAVADLWVVLIPELMAFNQVTEGSLRGASKNDEINITLSESYQRFISSERWGTHTIGIGGDIGYSSLDAFEELNDIILNWQTAFPPQRAGFSKTSTVGDPDFDFTHTFVSGYLQDDWKISQNVSINSGIRVDYNTFLENTTISPQIGVAWDPVGDQKTVVRAGGGIYHSKSFFATQREAEAPISVSFFDPTFSGNFSFPGNPGILRTVIDDVKTPRTMEFSFGVERSLNSDVSIEASAIYREMDDQFYTIARNLPLFEGGPRPDPGSPLTFELGNDGWASYRAAALGFNKRFSNGWMALANYTWSRSRGNSSSFGEDVRSSRQLRSQEINDLWVNSEGPTNFDLTHQFKAQAVYMLPFDIMLSGFYLYRSGYPVTVSEDSFALPEPINTERLPNFKQFDLRLQKSFGWGRYELHVYFDMINAFNDRNVLNVSTFRNVFGQPNQNYLKPVSDFDYSRERESQIGIKFDF